MWNACQWCLSQFWTEDREQKFCNRRCYGLSKVGVRQLSTEEQLARATRRYWELVEVKGPDECWLWLGSKDKDGYGQTHSLWRRAHRAAWILNRGAIPKGLGVLHTCDTPACCNPAHLFLGTSVDNNADRHRKGRTAKVKYGDAHWSRRYPERVRRGSACAHSKVNDVIVLEIRAAAACGTSYVKLASTYSLHVQTIYKIVKRIRWTHLP